MKNLIIILVSLVCFSSCRTKKITQKFEHYQRQIDSLRQISHIKQIDTVVDIRYDVIVDQIENEVEVPIDCDSLGIISEFKFRSGSGPINAEVEIKENTLKINLKVDSIINYYRDFYHSKYKKDSVQLFKSSQIKEATHNESEKIIVRGWKWCFIFLGIIGIIIVVLTYKKKI